MMGLGFDWDELEASETQAVLQLSDMASVYRATVSCGKMPNEQQTLLLQKWTAAMDELHQAAGLDVEQSLGSLHVPLSKVARIVERTLSEDAETTGTTKFPSRLLLAETKKKWHALQFENLVLAKRRQATKLLSQSVRKCEVSLSKEATESLHAAAHAERVTKQRIESMANDLVTHLVKTRHEMQAQLAWVAQRHEAALRSADLSSSCGQTSNPPSSAKCEVSLSKEACPEELPYVEFTRALSSQSTAAGSTAGGGADADADAEAVAERRDGGGGAGAREEEATTSPPTALVGGAMGPARKQEW